MLPDALTRRPRGSAGPRPPRVISAVLVGVVLVLVVLSVSSSAREQLRLSAQRRSEHFVELSFTEPAQARACRQTSPGRSAVRLSLHSELGSPQRIPFVVRVHRPGGARSRAQATAPSFPGTFATDPGRTDLRLVEVDVPRARAYRLEVTLPGRSERLSIRCARAGGAQ